MQILFRTSEILFMPSKDAQDIRGPTQK